MDSDGIMAGLFLYFWLGSIISAVIGYAIDEGRGLIWGLVLGPIGWIIAAILKGKVDKPPQDFGGSVAFGLSSGDTTSFSSNSMTLIDRSILKKWEILKKIDPEVRAASKRVSGIDPNLDTELAEKYLILNDRKYLLSLTNLVIQSYNDKQEDEFKQKIAEKEAADQFLKEEFETARAQMIEYEQSLGPDRIDPETGTHVTKVVIYDGSLIGWRGGIRITFSDGSTTLRNQGMIKDFSGGDDSWT